MPVRHSIEYLAFTKLSCSTLSFFAAKFFIDCCWLILCLISITFYFSSFWLHYVIPFPKKPTVWRRLPSSFMYLFLNFLFVWSYSVDNLCGRPQVHRKVSLGLSIFHQSIYSLLIKICFQGRVPLLLLSGWYYAVILFMLFCWWCFV